MHEDLLDSLLDVAKRRFYGKYRGVVAENVDETKRGRLRVRVPAVMGDEPVWAMPCVPYAGSGGIGLFLMPEVGVGCWVEFEGGDPTHPIWTGCFWGENQIDAADAVPGVKFLRTRSVTIRIDDDAGEIVIENQAGSSIKLTALEIELKSKTVTQTTDATKTVLDSVRFDVNSGAFTVV